MTKPAISVLTTTWNRAHVMRRVYESLQWQTARCFEWIVVDDGSTDETPALLSRWQAEADFPITYYRYCNNRGRSAALNAGRKLVSGDYTLILDSDDALLFDGLKTVQYWRDKTAIDTDNSICALRFLYVDAAGEILGKPKAFERFQTETEKIMATSKEVYYRMGIDFDCVVVLKTDILQDMEFVELTRSEHCPESVTLGRLSNRYKMIFLNHPVVRCIGDKNTIRLSDKPSSRAIKWPRGNYLRALAILNEDMQHVSVPFGILLNAARKITRLGLHIRRPLRYQFEDLAHARARLLWIVAIPGGLVGYARDRLRGLGAPKAERDIVAWGPAAPPENPVFHRAPAQWGVSAPCNNPE